jgi:hypothetical protein
MTNEELAAKIAAAIIADNYAALSGDRAKLIAAILAALTSKPAP